MAHRFRAILCDLDGTLADTDPVMFGAYEALVHDQGGRPTRLEFEELNGLPLAQGLETLRQRHSIIMPLDKLAEVHRGLFTAAHQISPLAGGAVELLDWCRRNTASFILVTSADRAVAECWLANSGVDQQIDGLISATDVTSGKPAPEPFLKAADLAGCLPCDSIAIDDSAAGVESALAAGCKTIALGFHHKPAPSVTVASSLWDVLAILSNA